MVRHRLTASTAPSLSLLLAVWIVSLTLCPVLAHEPSPSFSKTIKKDLKKNALTAVFANSTKVITGFTAKDHFNFMGVPDPLPLSQCLQIKTLSNDSAIRKLGLHEGDLVVDVNGQHVTTAAEFLKAIKNAPEQETPTIRIDRRHNGASCKMIFSPNLFVMLKILSSEYQLYACGNIFRMPRF